MDTREKIIRFIKKQKGASSHDLCEFLGITRQALNRHVKLLISEGRLLRIGNRRGATYRLPDSVKKISLRKEFRKTYFLDGLEEDQVFREIETVLNIKHLLEKKARDISAYAFTELFNNAIEHSNSEKSVVTAGIDDYSFYFRIRDYGIGIFHSIYSGLKLSDENAAIPELVKGKTTTMKETHSGEGIFFTSRAADRLSLRSHKIRLLFDNLRKDIFVGESRSLKGTEVFFSVSRFTKKDLNEIFTRFAPAEFDYRFEKTHVRVKLFQEDYVSRSEARRLLSGLDRFREIVIDFKSVSSIGQGFADEIFRVFKKAHPNIEIKTLNAGAPIQALIAHVVDNSS